MPGNKRAAGEPACVSIGNVCILTDAKFVSLLPQPAAAGLAAFQAGYAALPAWQPLCVEDDGETGRVVGAWTDGQEAGQGASGEAAFCRGGKGRGG